MNVLNLSFLNEQSHRAFQHFINWISRAETLAQVFTFPQCSLYSPCQEEGLFEILWKANECWRSSPQMKLKIFLRSEPKRYEKWKRTGCLNRHLQSQKCLFFLLSILLKLENRNDANTNFCGVSGDNMLLALLTTQLTNSGYFLLPYTHLTTFLKRKFFWERVFVEY